MSAVNELLKLADELRKAQVTIQRLDSAEQTLRELTAKIEDKRAALKAAQDALALNLTEGVSLVNKSKAQAEAIVAKAQKEADRLVGEARKKADIEHMQAVAALSKVEAECREKKEALSALYVEYDQTAQQLNSLRADLDALKRKLG